MRWRERILTIFVAALLTFGLASCRTTSTIPIKTDIAYVEKGQLTPFSGYLMTQRMLVILYEDAERQTAEEAVAALREKYGLDGDGE